MSENKTPVDQLLDLFVYAPLGFAMEARKLLPEMIERGRQQVTGQVGMARVIGQFAVQQGQTEATKAVATAQKQAASVLENLGVAGGRNGADPRATEPPANRPPATAPKPSAATTPSSAASPPAEAPAAPAAPTSSVDVATLAIPDYDSLSASQVVPRLAGLSTDELEAVRDYEAGHRGRKTILNRVAQLQAQ